MIVTANRWRVERRLYISLGLLMILLSAAGFGPSIVEQSKRNSPATALVAAHGIVLGAWILLFLTQATLVATKRTAVHRRLGLLGLPLAAAAIVLGYFVLIGIARRGYDLSGDVIRPFLEPACVCVTRWNSCFRCPNS
jgi:hypothetical protein